MSWLDRVVGANTSICSARAERPSKAVLRAVVAKTNGIVLLLNLKHLCS